MFRLIEGVLGPLILVIFMLLVGIVLVALFSDKYELLYTLIGFALLYIGILGGVLIHFICVYPKTWKDKVYPKD